MLRISNSFHQILKIPKWPKVTKEFQKNPQELQGLIFQEFLNRCIKFVENRRGSSIPTDKNLSIYYQYIYLFIYLFIYFISRFRCQVQSRFTSSWRFVERSGIRLVLPPSRRRHRHQQAAETASNRLPFRQFVLRSAFQRCGGCLPITHTVVLQLSSSHRSVHRWHGQFLVPRRPLVPLSRRWIVGSDANFNGHRSVLSGVQRGVEEGGGVLLWSEAAFQKWSWSADYLADWRWRFHDGRSRNVHRGFDQ